ncbi:MAG TPA: hypothetical protein VGM03_23725, partial [Phycisphaerae bacterium]
MAMRQDIVPGGGVVNQRPLDRHQRRRGGAPQAQVVFWICRYAVRIVRWSTPMYARMTSPELSTSADKQVLISEIRKRNRS